MRRSRRLHGLPPRYDPEQDAARPQLESAGSSRWEAQSAASFTQENGVSFEAGHSDEIDSDSEEVGWTSEDARRTIVRAPDEEIDSDSEEVGWTSEDARRTIFRAPDEAIDSDGEEVGWTDADARTVFRAPDEDIDSEGEEVGWTNEDMKAFPQLCSHEMKSALRISRNTSLAYLLPAAVALGMRVPNWQLRSSGFAAAALFAWVHHAYEYEHCYAQPWLNRVDIAFAVSAALIEAGSEPITTARFASASIAAGSWLWQKWIPAGRPRQVYAHVVWHLTSSVVAATAMVCLHSQR